MAKAATAYKIPKTLGACADRIFELKALRLAKQKEADAIGAEEAALKEHVINTMPKSDTGASGKFARVSVTTKQVPRVEDWDKFYAHIKKTGQFELLQRRLSDTAVAERWENKKAVPGVDSFTVVGISLNKI